MSKGLEALEDIKYRMCEDSKTQTKLINKDLSIIEKELERLEELDNGAYVSIHINRYNELCDKEEALEIIKNKKINIFGLFETIKYENPSSYNDSVKCPVNYELTQEEYDLLREVLRWKD